MPDEISQTMVFGYDLKNGNRDNRRWLALSDCRTEFRLVSQHESHE